jgi:hypothetical protein
MRDGLPDLYGSHSLVNKDAAVGHPKSIPGFWMSNLIRNVPVLNSLEVSLLGKCLTLAEGSARA